MSTVIMSIANCQRIKETIVYCNKFPNRANIFFFQRENIQTHTYLEQKAYRNVGSQLYLLRELTFSIQSVSLGLSPSLAFCRCYIQRSVTAAGFRMLSLSPPLARLPLACHHRNRPTTLKRSTHSGNAEHLLVENSRASWK